jgi:hypothetical protein
MQSQSDQFNLAWQYEFDVFIETRAYRIRSDLGLNPSIAGVSSATERCRANSPLYIKSIVILGTFWRDIDDGAPGLGCFSSDGLREIPVSKYVCLADAKEISIKAFQEIDAEVELEDDGYFEPYDCAFVPVGIVLRDQFDEPVAEYSNGCWIELAELLSVEERSLKLEEVEKIRSEARFEGGWDNFATARGLHEMADRMERRLKIAERIRRVIA